jgi:phosphotransferase system HPr (HPr) family protein
MYEKRVIVKNKTGLHARPAAVFVQNASKFKSNITIEKDLKKGNAKSILSVLSLGVTIGTEVVLTAEGQDEEDAVNTLAGLIESRFGEE